MSKTKYSKRQCPMCRKVKVMQVQHDICTLCQTKERPNLKIQEICLRGLLV